jgi:hypothetical protein
LSAIFPAHSADVLTRKRAGTAACMMVHHVYVIAGVLAVLAFVVTMLLPAQFGLMQPARQ